MLGALSNWFHGFVDQNIYPVQDVNRTGVHTYNIAGHECLLKCRDDALCWVIYVHGNGVTLDTLNSARIADKIVEKGKCNVVAPAYPVKTLNGEKYDELVSASVAAVYNKIVEDSLQATNASVPIYLVGRSLGVAIVLKACSSVQVPPAGVACISGFDCIQARVPSRYSMLSCLIGDRFNNIQAIAKDSLSHVNKLIIHGTEDGLIPLSCARDLYDAATNATLEIVNGMGHDPNVSEWDVIYSKIHDFIQPPEYRVIACPSYQLWNAQFHASL